jgi:hypothetical protein
MKRFVFIFSGDDDAGQILSEFAASIPATPFSIVAFDNATTTGAKQFIQKNLYSFGALNTIVKRSEIPLPPAEARKAALDFGASVFPATELELPDGKREPATTTPARQEITAQWVNPARAWEAPKSEEIESFCTVATENFLPELLLLVHSLRARSSKPLYVAADDVVFNEINELKRYKRAFANVFPFRLATRGRLEWLHDEFFQAQRGKEWPRNDYPHCPPACLVKMDIAQRALELSGNTLYLDADFVVVGSMGERIAKEIDCMFTPSWHSPNWKGAAETFGRFNAGCVFVRNESFPTFWREAAIHRSRFMDQQCLDLAAGDGFSTAEFSRAHNFGFWRIWHEKDDLKNTKATGAQLAELLGFTQGPEGILLDGSPLVSFHVQMFHDTPGHAPLQRLVRHLLETSRNPLQAGLVSVMDRIAQ